MQKFGKGDRGFHFLKIDRDLFLFILNKNFCAHYLSRLPVGDPPQRKFSTLSTQKLYFRSYSHQILSLEGGGIGNGIGGGGGVLKT